VNALKVERFIAW